MRLKKKKQTTRILFIPILMIGAFQLIYLYSSLGSPPSTEDSWEQTSSDSRYRKHVVHRVAFPWQGIINSTKRLMTSEEKNITAVKIKNVSDALPPLFYSPQLFIPPAYDPLLYGHRRSRRGFLTIGIPSIRRPNTEHIYLYKTLESLINTTSKAERREITIVVLLSDRNETYNDYIARDIYIRFLNVCEEGFLRVIKRPNGIYPNFDKLKRTRNDNINRVHWRAKQNIDFGYLCLYSRAISDYYIQLEDDVLTARNYLTYIRNQIHNVTITRSWFMLEFSRLGFIGKLFKDSDLGWVANHLLENFDKAPGDLLLGKMLSLKGQRGPIHADFSLFQHNGKFSTLKNKMMPSIDSRFKDADNLNLPIMNLPKGNNPPAKFVTTFEIVSGYFPSFAYDNNSSTFFWAKRPRRHDYLSLQFENPQNFTRIIISTGDSRRKRDSLLNSALFGSVNKTTDAKQQGKCGTFFHLADFIDGEIDTKATGLNIPNNIVCLKIQLKRNSNTWVIIRDIVLI